MKRQAALIWLFIFSTSCLQGCERKAGKILKSTVVADHGLAFRVELVTVPYYEPERLVAFSCKRLTSTGAGSDKSLDQGNNDLSTKSGWSRWASIDVGPKVESKAPAYNNLPIERITIISSDFAFIDMGIGLFSVTFDGCKTESTFSRMERGRLFVNDEVGYYGQYDLTDAMPRAFVGYKLSSDGESACFRLDSTQYVKPGLEGFDLCTANRGGIWYSKKVRGEVSIPQKLDVENVYSVLPPKFNSDHISRLFSGTELKKNFQQVKYQFFQSHRLSVDLTGLCSRVILDWLVDPKTGFDVCTVDSGKTWYAMVAKGDLAPPSSEDAARVYSSTVPNPTFAEPTKSSNKPVAKFSKQIAPSVKPSQATPTQTTKPAN